MAEDGKEKYPLLLDDGPSSITRATDASRIKSSSSIEADTSTPRPASKGRLNDRFLKSLVRNAEGHNAALLRRERSERLGLRKHPLADKVKEIERKKLERARRDSRRSRSPPARSLAESTTARVKRAEGVRAGVDEATASPKVRGRGAIITARPTNDFGSARSEDSSHSNHATLGNTDDAKKVEDEQAEKVTEAATTRATDRRSRPIPPWSTEEMLNATADSWPFVKSNSVVIEEDEQGKWKCGAGYL
ncbi:protein of unknown function [Taphrina deformans PYCC 5710]|uniref:Uncharacterized protein n=1 Tax=Taphrina deformans (strain PYCC 5710 / ATCC 11124 / CBS 356.35 / IMI 108563 / JCM 9778 / NBRC 8474) TaxID=1097556 RepID=R4X9W9_TAPDE|nr:protein of unknown function [Taphrina deformans PYCC 5710]|eukprot:CCG82297.1 protein of unknown function [Taphrina deformans PYCC 5710]